MLSAILAVLGAFIGIGLIVLIVGMGFLSGVIQIVGTLVRQFKKMIK